MLYFHKKAQKKHICCEPLEDWFLLQTSHLMCQGLLLLFIIIMKHSNCNFITLWN